MHFETDFNLKKRKKAGIHRQNQPVIRISPTEPATVSFLWMHSNEKKSETGESCLCHTWNTTAYASAFSTSAIADFFIGIRQFLLLPNSTITSSSVRSMTTP